MEKLNNTVIEVLTEEHGEQVIAWFQKQGIDTRCKIGVCTKKYDNCNRYYGVINGIFDNWSIEEVRESNAIIIELPEEKTFPRMMRCWDDDEYLLRNIYVLFYDKQFNYPYVGIRESDVERYKKGDDNIDFTYYKHAKEIDEQPKEIEEQPKEMTLSEVCEKLGFEIKIVK